MLFCVSGVCFPVFRFFFFNDTATTEIYTLSLHDALPVYALTKHAVVGFVRSVAPQLAERGIRINMVNPGFVETPLLEQELPLFEQAGFPLLRADEVADAALLAARDEDVGQAWIVQPGRAPLKFRFPGVPGPRVPGAEGVLPPL